MPDTSSYEVVVVGGGVIGLSIARALKLHGVSRIAVIERAACGQEASWAAAGMLGPQAETDAADAFFELCARSRDLYPAFAGALAKETGIDVELDRTGTLYLAFSAEDARHLDARFVWQSAAGLPVVRLTAAEARRAEPFASPDIREALLFPNDWQVDNRKLIQALRRYADQNDIDIMENTSVESLDLDGGRVAGVSTAGDLIRADHVVLATGAWTSFIKLDNDPVPIRVEPVRGQMIMYRTARRLFGHVIYSKRGYIVPRADGRVLVGSTSEHVGFDKDVTSAAQQGLERVAAEISPSLSSMETADQWAGLRPYAADGLPVLGGIGGIGGVTIATAHYRNGILLAPLTAELVADKVASGVDAPAFTTFGAERLRFVAVS